jgi:hypothetical protein
LKVMFRTYRGDEHPHPADRDSRQRQRRGLSLLVRTARGSA